MERSAWSMSNKARLARRCGGGYFRALQQLAHWLPSPQRVP